MTEQSTMTDDAQDEIDQQREKLIAKIEGQLKMEHKAAPLFILRWEMP